jgi:hypothetical protein
VATIGLSKGEIRRLVLRKLQVVYRDWGVEQTPFARAEGGLGSPAREQGIAPVAPPSSSCVGPRIAPRYDEREDATTQGGFHETDARAGQWSDPRRVCDDDRPDAARSAPSRR